MADWQNKYGIDRLTLSSMTEELQQAADDLSPVNRNGDYHPDDQKSVTCSFLLRVKF